MDYYFEKSEFLSFENSLFHTPFHTRAQNEGMAVDKHLSTEPKKHQKMAIIRKKPPAFQLMALVRVARVELTAS